MIQGSFILFNVSLSKFALCVTKIVISVSHVYPCRTHIRVALLSVTFGLITIETIERCVAAPTDIQFTKKRDQERRFIRWTKRNDQTRKERLKCIIRTLAAKIWELP